MLEIMLDNVNGRWVDHTKRSLEEQDKLRLKIRRKKHRRELINTIRKSVCKILHIGNEEK
jgi:DNA-directed RNA polymerase subunit E'/Rpb7